MNDDDNLKNDDNQEVDLDALDVVDDDVVDPLLAKKPVDEEEEHESLDELADEELDLDKEDLYDDVEEM